MGTALVRSKRTLAAAAVVAAVLVLGGLSLVGVGDAGAASKKSSAAKVSDATMSWAVSAYVLTPNVATLSVAEVQNAEAPATFSAGTGWEFTDGTGTYDPKTGATTLEFTGALEFGNTSRGDYGFKIANPSLVLDKSGTGTLSADVSLRAAGGAPFGTATKTVVVDVTGASPEATKKHVDIAVTPTAFAAPFLAAVGELASHFQASGSSNDANKPPAPIAVAFDYKAKKAKS
jgi:hypothetical protein